MKDLIKTYSFVICATGFALLINIFLNQFVGKDVQYLIFLFAIILSSLYGGLKAGCAATALSAFLISSLLFPSQDLSRSSAIFQIYTFFAEGFFISIMIHRLKNTDTVTTFKAKEKKQAERITILEKNYALAQEEIKARDEFLSIASHELKTPLTSMLLQLQRALHNIRNVSLANFSVEHLLKMLEATERQTNRLSKMINDLLNVSLITTKKLELEFETFDVSELAKDVVESFSERLEREGYILRTDIQSPLTAELDKVRVEQMLTNLLSNAIKYGNKNPIELKIKKQNDHIEIVVVDHGIGIPSSQKEKIFDLFERGSLSHKQKGLGVGLYITHQIIDAHHGKIDVRSKEGKGSTFAILLPIKLQKPR